MLKTILAEPTRFLFVTGKGGVGKTALACATAIGLADAGKGVLLVSTDPASNLDEMLDTRLSLSATPIPGVSGLAALNIDPDAAAAAYRERVVAPYRPLWSPQQIGELNEQLAGACTTEIAAFDEFAALLAGDTDAATSFEHVIFDTAPTGHTLRLLSLPRAWTGFLESATEGASCLGPHSGLKMQEERFARALAALGDAAKTTIVLVTRADRAALREAERTAAELHALGIDNQRLVINAVFRAEKPGDAVADALERRGRAALDDLPSALRSLPATQVPLRPFNMVGVTALRALLDDDRAAELTRAVPPPAAPELPPLATIIDEIAARGHGLVMVMGKGGVGKTTIACAVAAALASRGHAVHLSTTDPAAHIATTLAGKLEQLTISRIDPVAETKAYVDRVMSVRGKGLDEDGRALLAEDLRSPCYEEVAVFAAFSRLVSQARTSFVVIDTAPTGHTLLLLDATGTYHKEIMRNDSPLQPVHLVTPLMRLRDADYTKILLVALAEPTPVAEAARLQEDLRRAQIEPYAWIINSSLAAAGSTDKCLRQRIAAELEQIGAVAERHANRLAVVPWLTDEPVGPDRLLALARRGQAGLPSTSA
jgi:arsenite/tail-anchored protein-transporting ATPase